MSNTPTDQQLQAAADDFNKSSDIKIKPFMQGSSLFIEEDKKDWATQAEFLDFVEGAKIKVRAYLKNNYGMEV